MKPYYTNEVLFEATAEELQMLRVGMSNWLTAWQDIYEGGTPEDKEYYKKMQQLYKDVTKCLEQLPF